MKLTACIILHLLYITQAKNVLIINHLSARSYTNIMEAIAITLASEHNVTYINRHVLSEVHPNLTFVPFERPPYNIGKIFKDLIKMVMIEDDTSNISIDVVLYDSKTSLVDRLMTDQTIQNLFLTKHLYDILIIPTTYSHIFMRFSHLMNIPLVQVAASYPMPWQNEAIGNPNYLSTDNSLLLEPHSESFYSRLKNFIQGAILFYRYHFDHVPKLNKFTDKYFPPNTPKIEEISRNTSLLLVNTNKAMVQLRPRVSNYVEIGGIHCRPSKDLPPEFSKFVNHPEGVIYMSLGFTVNSSMPQNILNSLFNVFRKLPQRVIFKFGEEVEDVPNNVHLVKFCPQQDILGHPNTRLFITQGGMLSLQEAVFHQVPVLILPIMFDQPTNAILAEKLGYGRYLRWSKFSEETFLKEISEILSNKKYNKRVKEVSQLAKDVQNDPKENLKWWINYILRHKGLPTSKYNRHEYNPTTYHIDLDILLFLCFISVSLLVLSVFAVVFILQFINKYKKVKIE